MKDGLEFRINPICDDWEHIEGYEALIADDQADGHTTIVTFEDSTPRRAIDRAIIYLENRIEELVDFKATLKRMIKEEDR